MGDDVHKTSSNQAKIELARDQGYTVPHELFSVKLCGVVGSSHHTAVVLHTLGEVIVPRVVGKALEPVLDSL